MADGSTEVLKYAIVKKVEHYKSVRNENDRPSAYSLLPFHCGRINNFANL